MSRGNDPYDPSAPEADVGSRTHYVSKKDVKVLLIGLPALAVILAPMYWMGVRNSEKARCTAHIGAIYEAIGLYSTEHDDKLPPVYRTGEDGIEPGLGSQGMPWTYVSDTMRYMSTRASFTCPAAEPKENVLNEHPEDTSKHIASSYGMYLPYGGFLRSIIPDPANTLILAETSNGGSQGSFDPLPYRYDGFMIGWDNSNESPNKETQSVTRLAFRDVSKGGFSGSGARSRHDNGIRAISANGNLITLRPQNSLVNIMPNTGLPGGMWFYPP